VHLGKKAVNHPHWLTAFEPTYRQRQLANRSAGILPAVLGFVDLNQRINVTKKLQPWHLAKPEYPDPHPSKA
jgi:hypothetical protein